MGNCRSRAKPVESDAELLEKYEAAEYKIVGLTESLQKSLEKLHDIESKIQFLQANLELKALEDKIKISEPEESPSKNSLNSKGITKRIHKMDQRDCDQKRKVVLQKKSISIRNITNYEKENLLLKSSHDLAISESKFKKEFQEKSYTSTPDLFARTRRLNMDDLQVKVEYLGNTPSYHSFSTRDVSSHLAFSQSDTPQNQRKQLENDVMEEDITRKLIDN